MPTLKDVEAGGNAETIEHVEDVKSRGKTKVDKATELLSSSEVQVIVAPEENARVLRKIDLVILPILFSVYCLQSFDKTSLSYASIFGLIQDTNLKGQEFSWLGSIVYIAQLVMQPVIAFLLVKFPIGKFISIMVLLWGIILLGMVGAKNFGALMATRFLLGAAEAAVGMWDTITFLLLRLHSY